MLIQCSIDEIPKLKIDQKLNSKITQIENLCSQKFIYCTNNEN